MPDRNLDRVQLFHELFHALTGRIDPMPGMEPGIEATRASVLQMTIGQLASST